MATLTVQNTTDTGADITFTACGAGGDQFLNSASTIIIVKNDDAAAKTVTVTAQSTSTTANGYGTVTKEDSVFEVGAGEQAILGSFGNRAFNDANGYVQITYSAVTSLSIAALKVL